MSLRHRLQLAWHSRLGSRRPGLLVNSIPKSGTHLAMALLRAAGHRYAGFHRGARAPTLRLDPAGHGVFAVAHALEGRIAGTGRVVHLFRDPIDVAVSLVAYVRSRPDHPLHRRLGSLEPENAFDRVLDGVGELEPLAERFRRSTEWARAHGARCFSYRRMREDPQSFVEACGGSVGTRPAGSSDLDRGARRWNPTRRSRDLPGEDQWKVRLRESGDPRIERLRACHRQLEELERLGEASGSGSAADGVPPR